MWKRYPCILKLACFQPSVYTHAYIKYTPVHIRHTRTHQYIYDTSTHQYIYDTPHVYTGLTSVSVGRGAFLAVGTAVFVVNWAYFHPSWM